MLKEFEKELPVTMGVEDRLARRVIYEQMVRSFAYLLVKGNYREVLEKYPVEELESFILEKKKTYSIKSYYFFAGIAMCTHYDREMRNRKRNHSAATVALGWFMKLIEINEEECNLK